MPRLITPDVRARASFVAAMDEFAAEARTGDDTIIGSDLLRYRDQWRTAAGFAGYLADLVAEEHTPRWAGFVTQTTYWWVDGPPERPEFLGRIAVRHALTDSCANAAGTSATTCGAPAAARATPPRCCAPRCGSPTTPAGAPCC